MKARARKTSAAVLLSLTLFVGGLGIAAPRPAHAQLAVIDPVTGANTTIRNFEDFLDKVLLGGVTMGFINALNYFAQKIAYDAAVFISAGGKGEGPLFQYKDFGSYLGDVALGAAGEAIGTFSEIGFLGFNLCEPAGPDAPRISLALQLGIASQYEAPEPRCEWSRISESWDQFTTSFETGEVLRNIQLSVGPGQTGLHGLFQAPLKVAEKVSSEKLTGELEREEGQGFKSLTDVVTGRQKTPAAVVRETALEQTARSPGQQQQSTASVIGPVLSQGVLQVLSVALGTFVNTLASQLLNRAFEEGSFDVTGFDLACAFRDAVPGSADALSGLNCPPDPSDPEAVTRGGKAAARAAYSSLLAPRVQEVNSFDAVAEFTVCPDSFRGPQNCAMDPGFAAGVRVALQGEAITIRDALQQGYLHADWPLVPPTGDGASRNADPFCFNNGYCYSNLVKLRKARIIPIGFELAAEKALPDTTLGKVVDAFDDCSGVDGQFCKLIDPDWLLKYPLTQCRAKVFGPTLLAGDSDIRGETCVDAPTCIAENADGTCGAGFGYCTREKNIWRLGGDACPAQYASCQAYAGPEGRNLSVLKNAVDKAICSFENAGCNWYATEQDPADGPGDWTYQQGRLFLDRDGGTCEEEHAGCSEFVVRAGLQANLVRNPSFELNNQTATRPDFWEGVPTSYVRDIAAADGTAAVSSLTDVAQSIGVDQGEAYALSATARRATGAAGGRALVRLTVTDAAGTALGFAAGDSTCAISGPGGTVLTLTVTADTDGAFSRDACAFTVPFGGQVVRLTARTEGGALADAIQLEYGATATTFRGNTYQGEQRTYLKQPPSWLGCTGELSDPPECDQYAGVCRPDEVGCDAYTPATGGLSVPGIVSQENRCDAACAGYATYKEEASPLSYARYPVHLIPTRGQTCSLAAAGCTEFTNLDAAAAGGEAREYYATLRTCEKPRPGEVVPVYYTWEGSDTTGFQLKEWQLKAEVAAAPGGGRPPALIRGTDPAGCTRAIYLAGSNPDCREFFDVAGNISYRLYSKTIVISPDCRPLRMTALPVDESATAVTCGLLGGRFVDGSCSICEGLGGTWNDPSGTDLGCTFNAFAPESRSCTAAESGCRLYTGNAGGNVRREGFWDFESGDREGWGPSDATTAVSTESTAVGGHSIRVNAGGTLSRPAPAAAANNTYYLTFWGKGRGAITARFSGAPADRSFTTGGITLGATWNRYSLGPVVVDWTPAADETLVLTGFSDVSFVDRIELTRVASNIGLVKDSWTIPAICDQNASGAFLPQAQLGCTQYRAARSGNTEYLTGFSSLCREKAVGCTAYVATQQSPSPGRESWNALCVLPTAAAAPTPCSIDGREVCTVGVNRRSCRYQADDLPSPVTFDMSAAGVCQVDGIVIVDGTGTPVRRGTPGECTGQPQDLVVVPADKSVYLVDDENNRCEPEFAGCALVGRSDGRTCTLASACTPAAGRDTCDCLQGGELLCRVKAGETACRAPLPFREPFASTTQISYAETTVLNDPKRYDQSLCSIEAVGCQEWTEIGPTTGKAYFKDPETRTCEYREDVPDGSGRSLDGWYRTGTDIACDSTLLVSGETFGIWKNGDEQYQGFVGQCPASFSTCSEFLDPADRDTRAPLGRPYYFLKNQKIDTASCRGQVNPLNGCVLFNDTTDPNVTANTLVTNSVSAERGNASVAPATCPGPGCSQCMYRRYVGRVGSEFDELFERTDGQVCGTVSDCTGARDDEEATCVTGTGGNADCPAGAACAAYFVNDPRVHFIDAFGSEHPTVDSFLGTLGVRGNDANVVLNVSRDRVCGEWLACQSSTPVWDPTRNRFIEICDAIGRCNEYQKNGDSTVCVSWVNREPEILTEDTYTQRNVSYAGQDYSGYSIPHLFDVESLRQVPVGRFCTGDTSRSCSSNTDCESPAAGICNPTPEFRLSRVIGSCPVTAEEGSTCTNPDFPERGQGRCWQGTCAQAPNGSPVETETLRRDEPQPLQAFGEAQNAESPACRAYPERSSPFPNAVVKEWNPAESSATARAVPASTQPGFNRAATCEKGQDCECTYRKIEYRGGQNKLYTSLDDVGVLARVQGLCSSGPRDKQPCDPLAAAAAPMGCGQGGTCQTIERNNIVQGLNGYCLERDLGFAINGRQEHSFADPARACITWLPVDRLSGAVDVYNNYPNAGFNIENAAFCAVPEAYKRVRPFSRGIDTGDATVTIDGEGYPFGWGCFESTNSPVQGTSYPFRRASGGSPQINIANSGGGNIPEYACPTEEGFTVMSMNEHTDAGPFGCSGADWASDDDYQFLCVPRNSRHMADPLQRPCLPPTGGVRLERYNLDAGRNMTEAEIRSLNGGYAEVWGIRGWLNSADNNLPRPDGITQTDGTDPVHTDSAMFHYADCVATDTVVPDGPGSPGTPFLGCEAAVRVATSGRPGENKVMTGRIGNGRVVPPGSPFTVATDVASLQYTWAAEPEPFGRVISTDVDLHTASSPDFTPVEINTCVNGGADGYFLSNASNACETGSPVTNIHSETRSYAEINASRSGAGTSCTPGRSGDLDCSERAVAGSLTCSKVSGSNLGCFVGCNDADRDDAFCADGSADGNGTGQNLGRCDRIVGGSTFCTNSLAGDWVDNEGACESDANRQIVGTCRNAGPKDGSQCTDQYDCTHLRCESLGPESGGGGYCTGGGGGAAICDISNHYCRSYASDGGTVPTLSRVTDRLKQLFARVYGALLYSPQNVQAVCDAATRRCNNNPLRTCTPGIAGDEECKLPDYTPVRAGQTLAGANVDAAGDLQYNTGDLVYDISNTIGAPPVVRSVGDCNTQNQCLEGPEGQVSVNGVDDGQVKGGNGNKNITLRFFAYAQNDQMPLRNITVDWGDGTNPSGNNPGSSYKNRRGYEYQRVPRPDGTEALELTSLCDGDTFGTSPDACDAIAPLAFNHAYICNRDATARCFDGTNDCVEIVDGRPACVYKPRVQALDNWGFCNGTCAGGAPTTDSNFCYDGSTNPSLALSEGRNECLISATPAAVEALRIRGIDPFTPFAGEVVVFPRE
ncbi:hypothetical protein EPO33_05145 [Patescibacteria group bacterium]|nr:MAG: hypothetical protein EPO33_05145 [Patescibacteria group bacterium]